MLGRTASWIVLLLAAGCSSEATNSKTPEGPSAPDTTVYDSCVDFASRLCADAQGRGFRDAPAEFVRCSGKDAQQSQREHALFDRSVEQTFGEWTIVRKGLLDRQLCSTNSATGAGPSGPDPANPTSNRADSSCTLDGHPAVWQRQWGGFRSFCTTLGHDGPVFEDPLVEQHLTGAAANVA